MHDHARLGREPWQVIRRIEISGNEFHFTANPMMRVARVEPGHIDGDLIHVDRAHNWRMYELAIWRNDANELCSCASVSRRGPSIGIADGDKRDGRIALCGPTTSISNTRTRRNRLRLYDGTRPTHDASKILSTKNRDISFEFIDAVAEPRKSESHHGAVIRGTARHRVGARDVLEYAFRNEASMRVHHAQIRFMLCTRPRFVETRVGEMRVNPAEFERGTRIDGTKNAPRIFDTNAATTHPHVDLDMHRKPRAEETRGLLKRIQICFVMNRDVQLTAEEEAKKFVIAIELMNRHQHEYWHRCVHRRGCFDRLSQRVDREHLSARSDQATRDAPDTQSVRICFHDRTQRARSTDRTTNRGHVVIDGREVDVDGARILHGVMPRVCCASP
ncbi:MAG: hypothetical protein RIR10_821 [Planctomycetota bacterium]